MEKIVITPRGFANQGKDQIEHLRSLGYEVVFNDTGKAYGSTFPRYDFSDDVDVYRMLLEEEAQT